MSEYTFFAEKVHRWGKDMSSLWGNLNICHHLYQLELPCHSQVKLFSISSLKVWGNIQKPCCNIAYLLVWVENAMKDSLYGISLVWVNPNQVRVATMEEAVKTLTACTSSGTNWPYALAQLYEGPCHTPLPKDKHLGILPQGKVEDTPCRQISQLKVCQLLATGPQVVYPIGLNGHDEPLIITLPEPLDSGICLTVSKHIYLEIDVPSLPMEEPDQKIPPLSEVSIILITSPHKSPPKSEGSMTMEVSNLLSWAVLEASNYESKCSSSRRSTTAAVLMTPPQKLEGPPQAVNTSSQVSMEEAEASLEDIPTNISPIAAVSRSRSISPSMDLVELWPNANRVLNDLLNTKGSIEARRQRTVWELGIILHHNESQVAASIKEAKVICSQVTLDAWTACSQLILEAKTDFLVAVKKAKTTRAHLVWEAEAACSKTICEAKALKVSQAVMFHKEHGNYMQDLEEQAMGEESRSDNDFFSACQVILYNSPTQLKGALATSYHLLLGQTPPLPPLILPQISPMEEQPTAAAFPHQHPDDLLGPKDDTLCQIPWRACLWVEPL